MLNGARAARVNLIELIYIVKARGVVIPAAHPHPETSDGPNVSRWLAASGDVQVTVDVAELDGPFREPVVHVDDTVAGCSRGRVSLGPDRLPLSAPLRILVH